MWRLLHLFWPFKSLTLCYLVIRLDMEFLSPLPAFFATIICTNACFFQSRSARLVTYQIRQPHWLYAFRRLYFGDLCLLLSPLLIVLTLALIFVSRGRTSSWGSFLFLPVLSTLPVFPVACADMCLVCLGQLHKLSAFILVQGFPRVEFFPLAVLFLFLYILNTFSLHYYLCELLSYQII